ncbi:MAG: hypothetical protein IKD69_08560 [Solobacterium sp.]|nr:hypothetical protein [Solobacterium sp.]
MKKLRSKPFVCTGLRDDPDNLRRVKDFVIDREEQYRDMDTIIGLEAYLRHAAWDDDYNRQTKVYVIRDERHPEMIAAYFSLKAGMVAYRDAESFISEAEREHLRRQNIKSIPEALPAIELAHFAVNDSYRRVIRREGAPVKGLGAFFYPQFIYPIILEAADMIGVRLVYLYAAGDEALVAYYRSVFRFHTLEYDLDLAPIKPDYDQGCTFMYRSLHS